MASGVKGRHSKAIHGGLDPGAHQGAVSVPIFQTSTFAFPSAEEGAARFAGTSHGPIYTRLGNNPTIAALEACVARARGRVRRDRDGHRDGGREHRAPRRCSGKATTSSARTRSTGPPGSYWRSTSSDSGSRRRSFPLRTARRCGRRFGPTPGSCSSRRPPTRRSTWWTSRWRRPSPTTPGRRSSWTTRSPARTSSARSSTGRRRAALDDQVAQRALRRGRRNRGDARGEAARRLPRGREVLRHDDGPSPGVAGAAWASAASGMRVERAQENARALAPWLESHPAVAWVRYPGLPSHPQYELATRQMDGPGSVIAFELRGGVEAGRRLMNAVRLIVLAVSLGGDRVADRAPSLDDTLQGLPADEQRRQGITPGWCASRWGARTSTTCGPTSSRRSPRWARPDVHVAERRRGGRTEPAHHRRHLSSLC